MPSGSRHGSRCYYITITFTGFDDTDKITSTRKKIKAEQQAYLPDINIPDTYIKKRPIERYLDSIHPIVSLLAGGGLKKYIAHKEKLEEEEEIKKQSLDNPTYTIFGDFEDNYYLPVKNYTKDMEYAKPILSTRGKFGVEIPFPKLKQLFLKKRMRKQKTVSYHQETYA